MLFECVYGGAIGASIPLVVTCASSFAGLTITCTDGTKTLTKTCSSTSPYEVEFMLPNIGTWTISGTISGTTYTESVLVENFDVELTTNLHLTVDVYSAANDTISYTGIDNQTHTITTDSNGHATATITINGNGSTFTFTSSVAKKPTNLSSYYSKSISLTSSTSSIYVMPDNALYWWGYKNTTITPSNYKPSWSSATFVTPTVSENTNSFLIRGASSYGSVFFRNTPVFSSNDAILHAVGYRDSGSDILSITLSENYQNNFNQISGTGIHLEATLSHGTFTYSGTTKNIIPFAQISRGKTATLIALWFDFN